MRIISLTAGSRKTENLRRPNRELAETHFLGAGLRYNHAEQFSNVKKATPVKEMAFLLSVISVSAGSRNGQPAEAREAAKLIDVLMLDHLIVGDKNYYSFADNGMM